MDYLCFETEAAAHAALETIYANMVKVVDSPDLIDVSTGQVVPKHQLTPDEAVQVEADNRHFPVFGVNAATGLKDTQQGFTTAWAVFQQTAQGAWVFPKPDDKLIAGLSGYTVEEFSELWFPQPETIGEFPIEG